MHWGMECESIAVAALAGEPAVAADEAQEVPQFWRDVIAERERQQTVEGWTPEHDDEHDPGELSAAASAYAWASSCQQETDSPAEYSGAPPTMWPWDNDAWKLKDARRNLVRATALLLAEGERFDRRAASQDEQQEKQHG